MSHNATATLAAYIVGSTGSMVIAGVYRRGLLCAFKASAKKAPTGGNENMNDETTREECPADMRHHGGHVWERKHLFAVEVGVGDVITIDVDVVCLDCGERRNIVRTVPIVGSHEIIG